LDTAEFWNSEPSRRSGVGRRVGYSWVMGLSLQTFFLKRSDVRNVSVPCTQKTAKNCLFQLRRKVLGFSKTKKRNTRMEF
jgi:hypothetical protein